MADEISIEVQDISGSTAALPTPQPQPQPQPPPAPSSRRGSLDPTAALKLQVAAYRQRMEEMASEMDSLHHAAAAISPPDKLSFKTVDSMVKQVYTDAEMTQSTALDILAVYLKGQKILYTEAKTLVEQRLHTLMLPAILVSAVCTVLALQLKDYIYGGIIVASLNGFNSFILALISYLKLDAKAEAHKTSAYKYDKLQAYCEFKSGSILFVDDPTNNVAAIIKEIETNVKEIKETNQFVLPESVRYNYEQLYNTNIFSNVKCIQNEEMILTNKLKGVINALVTLHASGAASEEILAKETEQNELIDQIIKKRDKYMAIDGTFNTEIKNQITLSKKRLTCMGWLKT
jgi:hypothetical protein